MDGAQLLGKYSVIILPVLVVAEQLGVPLPAVPALLAVGALAANGHASIPLAIGAIVVVALPVDLIWHELGRRRGAGILSSLCRLTLEPDSCVRRTENLFLRHGAKALLVSKFLPGLTTVMPPLAGIFGVSRFRFAVFEVAGVVLWSGFWTGLGYVFSDALEVVVRRATGFGKTLGLLVAVALVAYILFKYVRRRLFLRRLRIARITLDALREKLDAGHEVIILDLRSPLDVVAAPYVIPGARWITTDALDEHVAEIPRDRDLIVYCT